MGVFDGIKVLELAGGLAAPYAAMFLADAGADVVKVEGPSGDPYRDDPGFQTVNRNKRSAVVGASDTARLMAAAEVLITDRPGQAGELRAANPGAVIVTMPPWGERGPLVDQPSSRALLHAATGIAWNQQSYAEVPVDIVVPIAQYATGVLGALAAATGLLIRGRRGVAPTYEVSEVAGAAALLLGEFHLDGPPQIRPGESALGSKGRVACYRLVEASDGRWLFLACGTAPFYRRLLDVIDRADLVDDPDLANPPWGLVTDEAIARLTPILDEVFATRPRDQWLADLAAADVPAQPVLTRDEFRQTSMATANGMVASVEHPELGTVDMMGLPFTISSAPGSIRRPAPLLGQHTAEVLDSWLSPPAATSAPAPPTARSLPAPAPASSGSASAELPLAGVRVVDLSSFIAGPVISRHLAMLGAEVVKVEPPTGDPFRGIGPMFISWNQGKRSITLDLTTDSDRRLLHQLVTEADVVVENYRPGVAQRLGADRETLSALNPRLVFLSSPGYGTDPASADRPAFDPLIQALGGLMAAQGGLDADPEAEPVFLTVPVHDVVTPLLGALAIVEALWQRDQTGHGQHVQTSLVQSTMVAQAAEFTRFDGRPATAQGGFDYPGPDDAHTWIDTPDGPAWRDGDLEVPLCRIGLTADELANVNELTVTCDHPEHGRLVVFGQLIGGAGSPPDRSPLLDEHGPALRAELSKEPDPA